MGTYVCIYEKRRMLNTSSLETSVKAQEMLELYFFLFIPFEEILDTLKKLILQQNRNIMYHKTSPPFPPVIHP